MMASVFGQMSHFSTPKRNRNRNMQPPIIEIKVCKHCGKYFRDTFRCGGNTFGAISFTDGKPYAPMLSFDPLFTRCPHCRGFFWARVPECILMLDNPYERYSLSYTSARKILKYLTRVVPNILKAIEEIKTDFDETRLFADKILPLPDTILEQICQRHPELKILREIGSLDNAESTIERFPWCPTLRIPGMFGFLNSKEVTNEKQEYTVRFEIWLTYNDRVRSALANGKTLRWCSSKFDGIVTKSAEDYERWKGNLERLQELAEKMHPKEYLRLAEMNRHLGNFEKAAAILEKHKTRKFARFRNRMLEGCKDRNRYILPLEHSDD